MSCKMKNVSSAFRLVRDFRKREDVLLDTHTQREKASNIIWYLF